MLGVGLRSASLNQRQLSTSEVEIQDGDELPLQIPQLTEPFFRDSEIP